MRSGLGFSRISTANFDNQASQAWYGVDRMKSQA